MCQRTAKPTFLTKNSTQLTIFRINIVCVSRIFFSSSSSFYCSLTVFWGETEHFSLPDKLESNEFIEWMNERDWVPHMAVYVRCSYMRKGKINKQSMDLFFSSWESQNVRYGRCSMMIIIIVIVIAIRCSVPSDTHISF